jgi:hypothetical protein
MFVRPTTTTTGLDAAGLLQKNSTVLMRGGVTSLLRKANVYEAELSLDAAVRGLAPTLAKVEASTAVEARLTEALAGVHVASKAIKLQRSRDGGCFPIHFDTDRAIDGRLVTAIVYLNDTWQPGDGGELRLYPFPRGPVTIDPVSDRMVLFASRTVAHRVLPTHRPRCCFTIWCSGTAGPGPAMSPASPWSALLRAGVREHLCKLVYADEWAASLAESHARTPGLDDVIAGHWAEVSAIAQTLAPVLGPVDADMTRLLDEHEQPQSLLADALAAHVDWI